MAAKKKEERYIPCQYGCGKKAEGSLNVSFTSFEVSGVSYREGFSVYIPCCHACVKGAVKLTVKVPDTTT